MGISVQEYLATGSGARGLATPAMRDAFVEQDAYLKSLMQKYLNNNEYEVLRLSYGLDCDKHAAKEIATKLGIEGTSNYVRISELKKQAVNKLIDNVDHSQVLDYL